MKKDKNDLLKRVFPNNKSDEKSVVRKFRITANGSVL